MCLNQFRLTWQGWEDEHVWHSVVYYHHNDCGNPSGKEKVEHGHEGLPGLWVEAVTGLAPLPGPGHLWATGGRLWVGIVCWFCGDFPGKLNWGLGIRHDDGWRDELGRRRWWKVNIRLDRITHEGASAAAMPERADRGNAGCLRPPCSAIGISAPASRVEAPPALPTHEPVSARKLPARANRLSPPTTTITTTTKVKTGPLVTTGASGGRRRRRRRLGPPRKRLRKEINQLARKSS